MALVVTGMAESNIALVKYWGKYPSLQYLLPATSSLSMTLLGLGTRTRVSEAEVDSFVLRSSLSPTLESLPPSPQALLEQQAMQARVFQFVDRAAQRLTVVRRKALRIESVNSVPTASGLASSASAFAALTMALAGLWECELPMRLLSAIARDGSVSAARSMYGGFVELPASVNGEEVFAAPLELPREWPLKLVVAQTTERRKASLSREGMLHTMRSSCYYSAWLSDAVATFTTAKSALLARDLAKLGAAVEHSAYAMHASMWAAQPPLMYWNSTTFECIQAITQARKQGLNAYVTMDAGPHVKVLCEAEDEARVIESLQGIQGVISIRGYAMGSGAHQERSLT